MVEDTDPLEKYRGMRDFSSTREPAGHEDPSGAPEGALSFVVQRHRARALHYDFRLEMDGVLASWAVPKGPSLDPAVRRLAVHVEDHPLEYAAFEGVIPGAQYGAGDVIVWDRGTWVPYKDEEAADPRAAVEAGELHAELFGERLRGKFVLVRTQRQDSGKDQWLLLHKHDEHAVEGWDAEDLPRSVVTGRTNTEVQAEGSHRWHSDRPVESAEEEVADDETPEPVADDELAALDDLRREGAWEVFGRRLKVTNLDKVLFPARPDEEPVTKRDLLRFVARTAHVAIPHLRGHALNLNRYPDGAEGHHFWHKEVPSHAPDWLPRWDNPLADPGETTTYAVADEPAVLLWAANFGALEWHPWTSLTDEPEQPVFALFDLDPGERTSWEELLLLARLHRTAFEKLEIRAQPKVTGRRGIQIWVPITRGPSFTDTRKWVEKLSKTVGAVVPELLSWKWGVRDRGGKARLDYTQNAINKTLVAPYSPRAAPGAPVSAPIEWDELDDPALAPNRFTIRNVLPRITERGDLFQAVLDNSQVLPKLK
jgi:bifunctional non-homologous end joining protein LigD